MLLSLLQCTGQFPQQRQIQPQMSLVLVEKPCGRDKGSEDRVGAPGLVPVAGCHLQRARKVSKGSRPVLQFRPVTSSAPEIGTRKLYLDVDRPPRSLPTCGRRKLDFDIHSYALKASSCQLPSLQCFSPSKLPAKPVSQV